MSDQQEKVFDYERQVWVPLEPGETLEQARTRIGNPAAKPPVAGPDGPTESGAAKFLLIGGIVFAAVGLLFLLMGVGVLNRGDIDGSAGSAALIGIGQFLLTAGGLLVLIYISIHAFFDIRLRRRGER